MSWLRRILGLKSRIRVAGTDLSGNKYIETQTTGKLSTSMPMRPCTCTRRRRAARYRYVIVGGSVRRTVKMMGMSIDQYTEGSIPHEWERMSRCAHTITYSIHTTFCTYTEWLRGSRQNPPTHEVLLIYHSQSPFYSNEITRSYFSG